MNSVKRAAKTFNLFLVPALLLMTAAALRAEHETPHTGDNSPATPLQKPALLERIGWRSLHWKASNFWVTASSRIRLDEVSPDLLEASHLLPATEQAGTPRIAPASSLLVQRTDSRIADNVEYRTAWVAPETLATLQRCRLGYGDDDSRIKCYRYLDNGVYRERRESNETSAPYQANPPWTQGPPKSPLPRTADWRVSGRMLLEKPQSLDSMPGWLSPPLLFPAISLFVGDGESQARTFMIHTDRDFFRLTATKGEPEDLETEYTLTRANDAPQPVKGKVRVLPVHLEVEALVEPLDAPFELLGFKTPITIFVDPETRIPLAIEGKAPTLGPSRTRLRAAEQVTGT